MPKAMRHVADTTRLKRPSRKPSAMGHQAPLRAMVQCLHTLPSTVEVSTHGNALDTRGTPAEAGDMAKESKRPVVTGLSDVYRLFTHRYDHL